MTLKPNRDLPHKEANLFKSVIKFYEFKQYKKAVKVTDQILKKFPEHGESLALKGLCIYHIGKKEDGHDSIKKGIKLDLTSHVCWHVYGLYYRAEKNYPEAIRCYKNALKYDSDNLQIIRDLALLQVQTRQFDGLLETRTLLLNLKPSFKVNWIALAVAYHLLGNVDSALKVFEAFEDTLKDEVVSSKSNQEILLEYSEILMYKISLLAESGANEHVIQCVNVNMSYLLDVMTAKEMKAAAYVNLSNLSEAESIYHDLMKMNCNNLSYIKNLEKIETIRNPKRFEESNSIYELYFEWKKRYPKSQLLSRRLLDHSLSKSTFLDALNEYSLPFIKKGVPSLFNSLKTLYSNPLKLLYCQEYFESWYDDVKIRPGEEDSLVWISFYLAQHFDRLGQFSKALSHIDMCVNQRTDVVEFCSMKGKIFKHAGNMLSAVEQLQAARQQDLSDRFVNSKSTKYLLRNNQILKAQQTIALFLKGDFPQKLQDLSDMQCLWYQLELAESHARQAEYEKALTIYHLILKIYEDIIDDQFDFHNYCYRKMTLRNYIKLLKFEDGLSYLSQFRRAFIGAITILLKLHTESDVLIAFRSLTLNEPENSPNYLGDSCNSLSSGRINIIRPSDSYDSKPAKGKFDQSEKITASKGDFLSRADKFVKVLATDDQSNIEVLTVLGTYYAVKGKWILSLKYLVRAKTLLDQHENRGIEYFINAMIDIMNLFKSAQGTLNEDLLNVVNEYVESLTQFLRKSENRVINDSYMRNNLRVILSVARSKFYIDKKEKEAVNLIMEDFDYKGLIFPPLNHQACVAVHKTIRDEWQYHSVADDFLLKMRQCFPLSTYFDYKH